MASKKLVKTDQHLLEYPIWILDDRTESPNRYEFKSRNGTYELACGERPPDATDALYLLAIMKISERQKRKKIKTRRAHLVKICGYAQTKKNYDRVIESIKRWRNVGITFDGCWRDGTKHVKTIFGIIEWAELSEETGVLEIKINDKFYEIQNTSRYYRLIDIDQYKTLRKPVARRLYEILFKHLGNTTSWEIEIKRLANKLTLQEEYPSHIIKKLNPAINQINKSTNLKVSMSIRKLEDGRQILEFRKLTKNLPRKKTIGLRKEASRCYSKLQGACNARWDVYQDWPEHICFYCEKFQQYKDRQPQLFDEETKEKETTTKHKTENDFDKWEKEQKQDEMIDRAWECLDEEEKTAYLERAEKDKMSKFLKPTTVAKILLGMDIEKNLGNES